MHEHFYLLNNRNKFKTYIFNLSKKSRYNYLWHFQLKNILIKTHSERYNISNNGNNFVKSIKATEAGFRFSTWINMFFFNLHNNNIISLNFQHFVNIERFKKTMTHIQFLPTDIDSFMIIALFQSCKFSFFVFFWKGNPNN